MKFRGRTEETETREEVREMAEALSLFGSAMRHMAERRAERLCTQPRRTEEGRARSLRVRLVLAPALGAAAVIAVAVPAWTHFHQGEAAAQKPAPAAQASAETRASVSDTVLMNQIDTDVSEEVPDALEPLAQLSEQAAAAKTTVSEKKNGTQE
ncbi:MAG TPA: hypothetical protein VME18_01815 [Acidobacteriaceae bacterium]|nr:hypothetical protein [Acidobacteriaceae bacterium]